MSTVLWGAQKRVLRFNMGAEQSVEGAPAGAPIDGGEPHPSVSLSSVSQEETIGAGAVSSDPVAETHKKCVEIDKMGPAEVVKMLNEALLARPLNNAVVEVCCRRVRVLCRDAEQCNECDKQGASAAVVGAMKALPVDMNVQLQGLAAIVNLCSGEANDHRNTSVSSGALEAVVNAMIMMVSNAEVQEMGCIALQNCCYGEDEMAIHRRQKAADVGALKAVIDAMNAHHAIPAAQEVGAATLRLILHKVPGLREEAIKLGAKPEWVKPFVKETTGMTSFRRIAATGIGTGRRIFKGGR
jgi:hypothetical protein